MIFRNGRIPTGRLMFGLFKSQPRRYGITLALWTVIWTMPVIVGLIVAQFFDTLGEAQADFDVATLVAALWAYGVARIAVVFLGMRNLSSLVFRATTLLKRNLIGWIYSLPGAHPIDETPGEVVSRFRDDSEHVVEAFEYTVDSIASTISAAVAITILFTIDPLITAVVFAPLVIVILIAGRAGTRISRYRSTARDATEAITGFLGETLGSMQSVKVAGAESRMLRHFEELNEDRRTMMVRDRTLTAGLEAVFRNTVNIGTGLILILAAGSISTGGGTGLTVGEFSLFVFLLAMVTDSAFFIGMLIARAKQAGVSAERMVDLMRGAGWKDLVANRDLDLDGPPTPTGHTAPSSNGLASAGQEDSTRDDHNSLEHLAVRDLTYRYPSSGAGIREVDLDIERGDFVVVTGRIASGKSTLLRTVLGLLPADSGRIAWNAETVDDPASFMVPPRTAYTPQVPQLFSMTLLDNLLLGLRVSPEELASAIRTATMEDDLHAMPDGLETLIGPRGVRLSGGQVQRSAAARMLVRSPDLYVFDDLSSALDVETEKILWDRLFADNGDATALVVSHRKPALRRASRVIVMRDGRIEASGTAEDLLESSVEFRRLWSGDFSAG